METVHPVGKLKRGGDGESPLPVEQAGRSLRSSGPNVKAAAVKHKTLRLQSPKGRANILVGTGGFHRYRERILKMYAVIGGIKQVGPCPVTGCGPAFYFIRNSSGISHKAKRRSGNLIGGNKHVRQSFGKYELR